MNIYQLIRQRSENWMELPAIHYENGSLSFGELIDKAEQLASHLKNKGIKEGMCLGIRARNSPEFIIAILGGLNCGVTVMPLSHKLTKAELKNISDETNFNCLLDDGSGVIPFDGNSDDIKVVGNDWKIYDLKSADKIFAPHVPNPAFIRFTSGTTGKSKGVILSHQSILERIEAANRGLKLGIEDAVVWVLPIAYHFVVSIILYLYYGAAIILCNDFLARAIVDYAARFKGTLLYCSPVHIRLLANDESLKNLGGLKKVLSTSSGISLQLCHSFKKKFRMPVSQAFGIIEAGLPVINLEKSAEHPEAVGFALPDYEVEILNNEHKILTSGEIGNLAIKGPGMFDAYLSPPQTRDEILEHGWFMTGDLASKQQNGLITIEGRKKSVINVSGNKVFPEEVEAVINSHPLVKASRVFGKAHSLVGERVEAEMELKEGKSLDIEELLRFCKTQLTSFKVPQFVKIVSQINHTATGKVKRT